MLRRPILSALLAGVAASFVASAALLGIVQELTTRKGLPGPASLQDWLEVWGGCWLPALVAFGVPTGVWWYTLMRGGAPTPRHRMRKRLPLRRGVRE